MNKKHFLSRFVEYAMASRERQGLRQLGLLDDHILRDIGFARGANGRIHRV